MDFTLTDRETHWSDRVRDFIEKHVRPRDQDYHDQQAEGGRWKVLPVIEEEKVPETVDVQKTMESMINLDGATLLFPTSFGYFDPHMLAMAKKFPRIQFRHCGGLWTADKHPPNTGSYFGYIGLIAFDKAFLATPIGPGKITTVGIPIALGLMVFTIVITGFYVRRANKEFDKLTEEIVEEAQ